MITELVVAVPSAEADRGWLLPEVNEAFIKATGIRHTWRHEGTTLGLALRAARELKTDLRTIEAVVVITQTPDHGCPAMACQVARELGLPQSIPMFDVNQACSGFVYGVWMAHKLNRSSIIGVCKSTLLIVVDRLRMQQDQSLVNNFIFSDAAAAIVLRDYPPRPTEFFNDTSGTDKLCGSREGYLRMDGGAVFDFVTKNIPGLIRQYEADYGPFDVLAQHQANKPMMEIVHRRSGFRGPYLDVVAEFGNMSMVSIPAAIAWREHELLGKNLLLAGYGAGWSAALTGIEWSKTPVSRVVRF